MYILAVYSNSSQWFICPRRKYDVDLGFNIVRDFGNNLNTWNLHRGVALVLSPASTPSAFSFVQLFNLQKCIDHSRTLGWGCATFLTWINSFNLPRSLIRLVPVSSAFYI